MIRQLYIRFAIPCAIISSVFVGVVLNFLSFLDPSIIDNDGSWFISSIRFADLLAITLILFTVISLTTIKFIEKIPHDTVLIVCVILTGFSLIYTSFSWNWQIYFMNFLITSIGISLILPIFIELMTGILPSDLSKTPYLIFFFLTIVIWVLTFSIIYLLIGVRFWRLLYIIVGTINIFSSILIINLEGSIDTR
ncbi:MAG: hypothetical protein ACFFFT_02380 [Candidatus Thorarchaeota archaeon]